MTAYKKLATELEAKLKEVQADNESLQQRVEYLQDGIIAEMGGALTDSDAKAVLTAFADRAKTKEELLLLIRTLTRV